MHILIVTDAWHPQINGVVRTYEYLRDELQASGHKVDIIGPSDFRITLPTPGYKEIRIPVFAPWTLKRKIREKLQSDTHVHIGTEGVLGQVAKKFCLNNKMRFSTCYHTEFPDYVATRVAKYLPFLYKSIFAIAVNYIRKFHSSSHPLFVATKSLEEKLRQQGYTTPISIMTRGVNFELFHTGEKSLFHDLKQPIALCVSRIAIEKNLPAFFEAEWPGTKVMVGDGPLFEKYRHDFPDVVFTGKKSGNDLANHFRSADIFVFPSKTDTFGMVIIEALASGLPVAAYPVQGPKDIITEDFLGNLDHDLSRAMKETIAKLNNSSSLYNHTKSHFSWNAAMQQFLGAIGR